MKLKPQPRAQRGAGTGRRSGATRVGPRPKGRQARRPGVPLRQRLSGRLPSLRRFLAVVAAATAVAALVAGINGPWLRVGDVDWAGSRYTHPDEIRSILDGQRGRSVLTVDTRELQERIEGLPAVVEADVSASLTGRMEARLVEREVAFVWETASARFLGAADGTIFARLAPDDETPPDLATAPRIRDERFAARVVSVGDVIPRGLLEPALRILSIEPVALGSNASQLAVRLDDEFGFRLISVDAGWEIAFGVYGTNPGETPAEATARLERQVTAVRTLFAEEPESGIGWVDVRNPGKVYFRAKG